MCASVERVFAVRFIGSSNCFRVTRVDARFFFEMRRPAFLVLSCSLYAFWRLQRMSAIKSENWDME